MKRILGIILAVLGCLDHLRIMDFNGDICIVDLRGHE